MAGELPNWFDAYAKPNFERFLTPLSGKDDLTFLQLGAYTGDASLWLLDNIDSLVLVDVDTWEGSDEEVHKELDFSEVERLYDGKVRGRTVKHKGTSVEYLVKSLFDYDFVYVDADHTAASALLDGELAWRNLKSGGIIAFDDYTWGDHLPAYLAPKLGVNLFLHRHQGQFELLVMNSQVWLRKL
jgi:predicted O-methyltransferase YrrM